MKKRKQQKTSKKKTSSGEKEHNFGRSTETYLYKKIEQASSLLKWVIVGVVMLVIGISIAQGYFSASPLFGTTTEIAKYAASLGDYEAASLIRQSAQQPRILGRESEGEEEIYPEITLEKAIAENSRLLEKFPEDKQLMERQAILLRQVGDLESANWYEEKVKLLNPNKVK